MEHSEESSTILYDILEPFEWPTYTEIIVRKLGYVVEKLINASLCSTIARRDAHFIVEVVSNYCKRYCSLLYQICTDLIA